MQALLQSIAASLTRALIPLVSSWLLEHGLNQGQVAEIALAVSGLLGSAFWIVWSNITRKVELNTALATPQPVTLDAIKEFIKAGQGAPAAVAPHEIPVVIGAPVPPGRD